MGRGVYGVEAAGHRFFGKPALHLNRHEAAALAAVLPKLLGRGPQALGVLVLAVLVSRTAVKLLTDQDLLSEVLRRDGSTEIRKLTVDKTTDEQALTELACSDDDAALRHIFRVACGLDSMVLGEPQILGQVKEAFDAKLISGGVRQLLIL